ncbi:YihY/virulence factor BrkB family protein [Demequina sp.]|uniref:YihY/virulence factor BrkB family protein n=1 Tax=Demequina sp. TaxID=2050685 RepID=UPI003D0DDEC0
MGERTEKAKAAASGRFAYFKALAEWVQDRPVGVAGTRYVRQNGNVLAGGIAYYSLASIAAAVVLGVTIASLAIFNSPDFREKVLDYVGQSIPGLFPDGDQPGLIDPDSIEASSISGIVGVIAFFILVYTATRYMRGLRAGVRTMLGDAAGKKIPGTLRDIIVLFALVVIAVIGTALQIIAVNFASFVSGLFGDDVVSTWVVSLAAFVVGFLMDCVFVALVLLVLGRAQSSRRVMVPTILMAGFAFAVLQAASGLLVESASNNSVLAPFAAIIALMLFVDLTARTLLIAAAWIGAVAEHDARLAAGEVLPPRPTAESVREAEPVRDE